MRAKMQEDLPRAKALYGESEEKRLAVMKRDGPRSTDMRRTPVHLLTSKSIAFSCFHIKHTNRVSISSHSLLLVGVPAACYSGGPNKGL